MDTTTKGDIGVAKALADLTAKGYVVLKPVLCEALPFDLVAIVDGVFVKIQCKYAASGFVKRVRQHFKAGGHKRMRVYSEADFDYFALYLPEIDKVVFPHVSMAGATIAFKIPNSATPFYWWEDFTELSQGQSKRKVSEFGGIKPRAREFDYDRYKPSKIMPSKDELEGLVGEVPLIQIAKKYGVSDTAVKKWCVKYGIATPGRGYWNRTKRLSSSGD